MGERANVILIAMVRLAADLRALGHDANTVVGETLWDRQIRQF
jgi:hypothetical protein